MDPRGSSRKFDSGSNSADLRVSSRKFDLGVVPSIACVTFMVYTNSAIEILLNTIKNPHFCRALRAHINAGFIRFPCFVALTGDLAKFVAVFAISVYIVAFPSIGPELRISRYSRAKWGTWPDVRFTRMSENVVNVEIDVWGIC